MSVPSLDPVAAWVLRLAMAALLALAAGHKLRDPRRFREVLAGYALLPAAWVGAGAALVPVVELAVATALLLPASARAAAAAAAGLFALYGAAIAVNLARGRRDLDCGCLGPAAPGAGLHGGLLVRNGLLVGCALAAASPVAGRPLGWLDLWTAAAGSAFLALAWATLSQLLVHGAAWREGAAR
jgi:hypothetical protein